MPKKPRVLIADDELAIARSCKKTLTLEGCEVDVVHNGLDALKNIEEGGYDLLITDLRMPKMDGMQLLAAIQERGLPIKTVMITGYGTVRSAVEAIKLGAFDYLSKPFAADELAAVAARALGRKQKETESGEEPIREFSSLFGNLSKAELERMWCIPEHSWVRAPKGGQALVGTDVMYLRLVGQGIRSIDTAKAGESLRQGEACAKIVATRPGEKDGEPMVHNVWSPIGGSVVEINHAAIEDPKLIHGSPYGDGWLLKIAPSALDKDLENLRPFLETVGAPDDKK
jgi:FixJ family two-component response regulator